MSKQSKTASTLSDALIGTGIGAGAGSYAGNQLGHFLRSRELQRQEADNTNYNQGIDAELLSLDASRTPGDEPVMERNGQPASMWDDIKYNVPEAFTVHTPGATTGSRGQDIERIPLLRNPLGPEDRRYNRTVDSRRAELSELRGRRARPNLASPVNLSTLLGGVGGGLLGGVTGVAVGVLRKLLSKNKDSKVRG